MNTTIGQSLAIYTNHLRDACHAAAYNAGWWHGPHPLGQDDAPYNYRDIVRSENRFGKALVAEKLDLCHSELSEALEGLRKNKEDDHLPHHKSITVELVDTLIRVFDLAGALNLPLGEALREKMAYNAQRADHKPEARSAEGGKAF